MVPIESEQLPLSDLCELLLSHFGASVGVGVMMMLRQVNVLRNVVVLDCGVQHVLEHLLAGDVVDWVVGGDVRAGLGNATLQLWLARLLLSDVGV